MSQSITPFDFHDHAVRVVMRDDDPWFVATDVAEALGYRNAPDAARYLAEHQKGSTLISRRTSGGNPNVTIINESGLYRLVLRSRKPEAVAFSDWVTGTVLPQIRKTGSYTGQPKPLPPAPEPAAAPVPALTATITSPGGESVPLPAEVHTALNDKALRLGMEMAEQARHHLVGRVTSAALVGAPKRRINPKLAMDAIADTTLTDVIAPQHMEQLRLVRRMARNFAAIANDTRDQLEGEYAARGLKQSE